ncbi:MAG: hypothetical protein KH319_02455 [Butyricicoccus pullicaecorum]|nr:hypothetical protein [Butyricicoccus pullicaecorum]
MKHGNRLEDLQNMKAPERLKTRTRMAAQEMREGVGQTRRQPQRGRMKRLAAVVCAMAIVAGGATVWSRRAPDSSAVGAVANSFGLVAYAADTGEIIQPQDSRIVFNSGAGVDDLEKGFFSGCLFKVTGDHIAKVSASIDKGGLYRAKCIEVEHDDVAELHQGTDPRLDGADAVSVSGLPERNQWWADLSWKLGGSFEEAYDADASYGFWGAPTQHDEDEDLQTAWHDRIDAFEGAKLTVTVTFTDGTTDSQTMTLHTGKLAVEYPDDLHGARYTGEVLTEEQAEEQGYLYGVYAEIE